MPKTAYYNEPDPFAAAWLRELIAAGHIAPGDVDERDVRDVRPDEVAPYRQCHFFAGIGVWSYALRLAGWPDTEPVWTGSCPCQPFSTAGRRKGFADERHLWPFWHHLIRIGRPRVVFGEQSASPDGLRWLDLVSADLEGEGYACGAVDLCAAGVGAPHIRPRLCFVAYPYADGWQPQWRPGSGSGERNPQSRGAAGGLAFSSRLGWREGAENRGRDGCGERSTQEGGVRSGPAGDGVPGGLAHSSGERLGSRWPGEARGPEEWRGLCEPARLRDAGRVGHSTGNNERRLSHGKNGAGQPSGRPGPVNGYWAGAEWVLCHDPTGPRWRPVEPGSFPLAHGAPGRVGRLRGYGNALCAPALAAFISAFLAAFLGVMR